MDTKRHLFLERKVMTNLDNILKSRDITLPTKVHLVKAMFFPVVMYGCESWTIKKTEPWRIDAFELWCWRLLRVPWTARRFNQPILWEISLEYSLEGLMLKDQYFDHLMWRTDSLEKTKDWRQEKGMTEDEMVGWHHPLNGHEFEQALGVGDGQPGVLQSMGSQPVGLDWETELNWLTETLKSGNEMNLHNSNCRQNNVKIITEIEYKNY